MCSPSTASVVCGLVLAGSIDAFSDPVPVLTVRVYDLAGAGDRGLKVAERTAAAIFLKAGIEVRFVNGDPGSPEALRDSTAASHWHGLSPAGIDLRILGHLPAGLFRGALGIARPFAASGVRAIVFYERIRDLASQLGLCPYTLLGHAMAHELGHVLLGNCTHSPAGIMRAEWTDTDFVRPVSLSFTRAETALLRRALRRP